MPINYAASDLLHRFTVNEAALLWCDVGRITEEHYAQFMIIKSAIVEALKTRKLKADEIPMKIVERRINSSRYDMEERDYDKATIKRNALRKWAEKNKQTPKFLFPEARTEHDISPMGTLINQYHISADHVVVTPTQKPTSTKSEVSSKPVSTTRESEMHELIERVYLALRKEMQNEPSSKQVMHAIETRQPAGNAARKSLMCLVAKAILFKAVQKLVRPMFPAFQANITTYTISLIANRLGDSIDLDKIWLQQDISSQLKQQVQAWAVDVDRILHQSAAGRMVSEWAKKPECWDAVQGGKYSAPLSGIPEVKASAVSSVV